MPKGLKIGVLEKLLIICQKEALFKSENVVLYILFLCSWVISGLLVYAVHCRVFALCWCETNAVLLSSTHCAVTLALVGCG